MDEKKIEDFNYFYFNPKFEKYFLPKRTLAKNLFLFFVKLSRDLFYDLFHFRFIIPLKGKVVFYSTSGNDHNALKDVYEKLNSDKILIKNPPLKNAFGVTFPRFIPTFLSLLYMPAFLRYYFSLDAERRELVNYSRNDVLLTFGYYTYFNLLIRYSRPVAVIMTNDHGFDVRVLIHTTNRYGVPSFYLQHASVTEDFPKLEMTYALLEGKDAKEKYLKNGSDPGKIHLIGMIKYDRYINQINKNESIRTIGYAINATENEEKLIEDLNYLIQHFSDMKIILRPHPWQYTYMIKGRLTKILQRITPADNFSISDPRKQSAFDFLGEIDLLISGDSSIHLEAVLVNVMSVYYDNQGKAVDHYGYLKNGVSFGARDRSELIEIINTYKHNRPYVKDKAKPYVDTINTPFEGKSSQLAINIIEEKLAV
jgi:hypothetical protein